MSNSESTSTCRMVCWAIAGLIGLILLWKLSATLVFILALLIGVILTAIIGIVLTRLFCTVEAAYTAPVATPVATPAPEPAPAPKPAAEEKPVEVKAKEPIPDYDGDGKLEGTDEGTRPEKLTGARGGKADDLKQIKGVGPKLEQQCNEMGFYHFDQIAGWSADEVAWVDANLKGFKGRVSRDNWTQQAKTLASGGTTEFSKRVKDGDVY